MPPLYSLHGVEIAYEKHVTLYEDYKKERQVDQFQMYPNVTLGQAFIDAPPMAEWYIQVRAPLD